LRQPAPAHLTAADLSWIEKSCLRQPRTACFLATLPQNALRHTELWDPHLAAHCRACETPPGTDSLPAATERRRHSGSSPFVARARTGLAVRPPSLPCSDQLRRRRA